MPDANEVLAQVMARPAIAGVRLVGVDGHAGAGKSTFARALSLASGAPVVEIDDFCSWVDFGGWWPRLEEQVLTPLFAGLDATYQVRDWKGDEFGASLRDWKILPWSPLVILEGVTCTRRAIADRLAYAVWADAPAEVRLRRGLERDADNHREEWRERWLRWQAEEDEFFAADGTRDRADLVIDTTGS